MTRINADIDPRTLKRLHLIAEYREIVMVPASLMRSLRSRSKADILKGIPPKFTLNRGHVTFFYNKLGFLLQRFEKLVVEMERRGYKADRDRRFMFDLLDEDWFGLWTATAEDNAIVQERIDYRISQKPHLYIN